MWKRIIAYIVGIPLVFLGLFYAYFQYESWQLRQQGRKVLDEIAAREHALDSLGDIALDPTTATLADLERSMHQPGLSLAVRHNRTTVGWACVDNECQVWASFAQPLGTKLDPGAMPLGFGIRDTAMRKRTHRISIGGIYLGEPSSEMLEYGKAHGYGTPVAYHHITWDKGWSMVWAETGGKISLLIFINDKLIKAVLADGATHSPKDRP